MLDFIYLAGGLRLIAIQILVCVFTLVGALAGFGLLRYWRWARIAVEILGTILFTCPVIVFLFEDFITVYAVAAGIALYSVVVALFVRYEPPNTALEPTPTAP